ncbi:4-diphosphocytidyl-2-C-methyl-D-erythritol kinase [Natronospira proteinivora]|uniref:4-diphosphocytidyl-2-C-methyl-D-erythritol kinase n=1 Tax=Natronospira proteinivora TaxID=1807133 RepID=A0ABT1G7T9_9GAMM|nr:4-(cytidine 5'-diphospho)-2-C-methyl-D-erythritol kinase [Natronospira proteinivora]MCP1727359.1 4-diphosphocytidyl-2-C-methyl-D-erythritol kinase [Natronospira proteinivora]
MSEGKERHALDWPAPAKLNLFLHVLGRRDDGYHDLQTLFQFLDLGDRLGFTLRHDKAIHRSGGLPGLDEDQDLVVRAAKYLREVSGRDLPGVDIRLDKQIPAEAGLGGGSSDAATTLHALNRLWRLSYSDEQLADIGGELGADVPVFVHGQAAWAEGRGNRFQVISDLPEPVFLVIYPDCAVSTKTLFHSEALSRSSETITLDDYLSHGGRNDFQPIAAAQYPAVAEALRWLACYGDARLTGTGACVFAALSDVSLGRQALSLLPDAWQGFLCRGMNRSSLRLYLDALG